MELIFVHPSVIGGAGSEKDPRVYWVKLRASISRRLFYSIEVSFQRLAVGERGGDAGTSTLGERSTTRSCMLRSGRMSRF